MVGALAAVDPDSGDTFTFTLVDDAGGRFAVSGANLVLAKAVDYETAQSHTVTVQVTDSAGNSFEKDLTIGVTDVAPGAPTDANSEANSVVEGAASGTEVGITALASDVNGGTVTYSLDDDAGGRFAIDPNTGVVTVADGSGLDANLAPSYTITVRASDPSGAYSTATFEIQDPPADPPNSAPTDITLSNTAIAEDSPVGAVVGALAAVDPDSGDTSTFTLIDNAGGDFAVSGANLVLAKAVDYETAQSQTVTVQVTDSAGNSFEKDLTIGVTDVAPGAPTDVNSEANSVVEGAASGTEVGITALASDVNGGTVTYSLDDDAAGRFAIDPNTGVVSCRRRQRPRRQSRAQPHHHGARQRPVGRLQHRHLRYRGRTGPAAPQQRADRHHAVERHRRRGQSCRRGGRRSGGGRSRQRRHLHLRPGRRRRRRTLRCPAPIWFWPRRSTTKPLNPKPSRCRSPIPPATALRRT